MKKILIGLLLILFLLNTAGCAFWNEGGKKESGNSDNAHIEPGGKTVTLLLPFPDDKPGKYALDRIGTELDNLVYSSTDIHLRIVTINVQTHEPEIFSETFEKEGIDLAVLPVWFAKRLFVDHKLKALDRDLDNNGNIILSSYPDRRIGTSLKDNNQIYAIPSTKGVLMQKAALLVTEILDRYGVDASHIETIEDLDRLFQEVYSYNSEIYMIADDAFSGPGFYDYDKVDAYSSYGILPLQNGQEKEPVCLYETDEYMNWCKWKSEWYLRGYIAPDVTEGGVLYTSLLEEGKALGFFTELFDPQNIAYYSSLAGGKEFTMVPLGKPIVTTESVECASCCYAVPESADNTVDSLRVLEFLMTSKAAAELLVYGQENIDYVRNASGTLSFPNGLDAMTVGYHPGISDMLPNPGILTPWDDGGQELKEEREKWQSEAIYSPLLGFSFDYSQIQSQYDFCNEVLWEYNRNLLMGKTEPEEFIPKMLKGLNENGLEKVMNEIRTQANSWNSDMN